LTIAAPIIQILSAFALIQSYDVSGGLELIFFGLAIIDSSIVNLLFFTGAQQFHTTIKKWLTKMKGIRGKNRERARVLSSMTPLRLWLGSNWVDKMTPLILQQFCWVQIANLLLLENKS
jgi:hypothetical protein